MKCDKCFFCLHIGKGIYADYPLKYCRYSKSYMAPFISEYKDGKSIHRQLDFSKISDCKIWHDTGCNIHPSTVRKAKNDFFKRIETVEYIYGGDE